MNVTKLRAALDRVRHPEEVRVTVQTDNAGIGGRQTVDGFVAGARMRITSVEGQ